jgi:purine catabolism regulator
LQDTRSSAVDVHIGIGGEGRSIEDFPTSYEKALLSVKHEFWNERKKTVSEWEDLGAEQMLAFPSAAIEEGNILYGAICAMHSLQQKTGKTPFFSTLLSLVCNNWNITAAAADLSLHYNSMKYRYDRISEMLEADMDNPRTRLEISLLLKAYLYRMPIGDFFTLF